MKTWRNSFSKPIGWNGVPNFETTTCWFTGNIYVNLYVRVPFPITATTGTPWFGIGSIHRLVIITWVIGKLDHIYSITKGHQTVQNDAQVVCQHVWSGRKRAISERTDTGWWFYKGISTILLILDQHTWNVGSSSRHQKKRCLSVISKLSVFLGLEKTRATGNTLW